jgi:hypothetical protein
MSTADAFAATKAGWWELFDKVDSIVEIELKRLSELSKEDADEMVVICLGIPLFGGPHLNDTRESLIAALQNAKQQIADIRLLCQETMAALPD